MMPYPLAFLSRLEDVVGGLEHDIRFERSGNALYRIENCAVNGPRSVRLEAASFLSPFHPWMIS
jgi:hypothetical protein